MQRHVVISGCSGGGKSTLLAELGRRGFAVVEEPGRRIVREEIATGGTALPWIDLPAFLRRAAAMARADRTAMADAAGWTFFDRGLIDAAVALEHIAGIPAPETLAQAPRYHGRLFMAPPWPDIYVSDDERRHDYAEAVAEYERLMAACPALGYEIVLLPHAPVARRADLVLATLGLA